MQARRMMITLRLGVHIGGERLADTLSSCPGRDGTARPCEDLGPYFVDITCSQKLLDRRNIGCPPLENYRDFDLEFFEISLRGDQLRVLTLGCQSELSTRKPKNQVAP